MKYFRLFVLLPIAFAAGCKKTPAPPSSEETRAEPSPPPPPAPAPVVMIPDGGYERVDALLTQAAGSATPSRDQAVSEFRRGFSEMDYRFLHHLTPEETMLPPVPSRPGDPSEQGGLKCSKSGVWEYPQAHPKGEDGHEECCRRNTKTRTRTSVAGDQLIMITQGDGYADTWDCYRWQPRRKTWSAYGEEELVNGFEFYVNKTYGAQRALSVQNQLFYEGAMYRIELERKRLQ